MTRFGWLVSLLASVAVLLAVLATAQPSHSAVLLPPPLEPVGETEDPEEGEEEGEEGEEVGGGEWEEEENAVETGPYPPDECLLRTARARLFIYSGRNQVRLVIRYTSLASARVSVDFTRKGKKGKLALGQATQRFQKKGVFRLTERLSDGEAAKVRSARGFLVEMRIPAAPSYCERYYSRRLTIKRTVHNQVVWFQSDSIFGTGR